MVMDSPEATATAMAWATASTEISRALKPDDSPAITAPAWMIEKICCWTVNTFSAKSELMPEVISLIGS